MPQCSNEQIEKIINLFKSLQRRFRENAAQNLKVCGYTMQQLTVMFILYETPNMMLNELSEKMGLTKSTVSSIIERMTNQGIIIREVPKDNRRTIRLSLSPQFIENHQNFLDKNTFFHNLFNFDELSIEDAEAIIYALDRVTNLMK
jgi:DNA-binding MarR family transcriptional regulator